MFKLPLTLLGCYFCVLSAFSQTMGSDTSTYKNRKLKLEEVNFVTSYYNQNGSHSAVTGGIGSEKLVDNSNLLELKFAKSDIKNRSRLLNLSFGVDAYTSASSDKIDPATISSASMSERRIYPSVAYAIKNAEKRNAISFMGYYSKEYDYTSLSPGINYTKTSKDNNKEISIKVLAFFDNRKIILPIELRNVPNEFTNTTRKFTLNSSFIYSHVINKRTQFAAVLDLIYQSGLLSTPYNRVYFVNNAVKIENLPNTRFKLPLGIRLNYFLGSRIVIRSFYRLYYDSWNIFSNTFSVEAPIKITPFISIGPIYRFYTQTAAAYFAPYRMHQLSDEFYTSDYDLSRFNSQLIGLNFRKVSLKGILGIKKLNTLELRYSYYFRTTNLRAHTIALSVKFK